MNLLGFVSSKLFYSCHRYWVAGIFQGARDIEVNKIPIYVASTFLDLLSKLHIFKVLM